MKAAVKTLDAESAGEVELSDAIFGLEPRKDLIHRMVRYQLLKRMAGTHHAQDRSEVTVTGKKMAGHMGNMRVTTLNLEVVETDKERGLVLVRGAVPGTKGGWVLVRDAVKRALPKEAPKPGSFRKVEAAAQSDTPAEAGAGPAEHKP